MRKRNVFKKTLLFFYLILIYRCLPLHYLTLVQCAENSLVWGSPLNQLARSDCWPLYQFSKCKEHHYGQYKPLNVITLRQVQTDTINQMIIITDSSRTWNTVVSTIFNNIGGMWSHKLINNFFSNYIKKLLLYLVI